LAPSSPWIDRARGGAAWARDHLLPRRADWLLVFAASTLVAVLGVAFGREYLPVVGGVKPDGPLLDAFVRWDGAYYRDIARDGYSYRVGHQSTIHFTPLYPLLSRGVRDVTGLSVNAALVLTSHLCFLAALALLAGYTERRYGAEAPAARSLAVLAVGFVPTGVFFHLAYTESLFLLLVVAELVLIERRAHPLLVALVACLGVVARPVGVALVPPLLLYAWHYGGSVERSLCWVCLCLPVALAGLAAFMGYCDWAFGDPLAFVRDREDLWRARPRVPPLEKARLLLTLEPVWGMFVPGSGAYWGKFMRPGHLLFGTYLIGPFAFGLVLLLIVLGGVLRRLNRYELVLAAGLVLVPYVVTGYDSAMISMARYLTVIVPLYSFGGFLLSRAPAPLAACLAAVGGVILAFYAALFAQGHWLI
jgi:hypothetical protein